MRSTVNPEGPRRDNDLQLPAVLFSILDKSKGRNEGKEEGGVGGEEGGNTNGNRTGSIHTGAVRKDGAIKRLRQRKDVIIVFIVSRQWKCFFPDSFSF